jgi:hypothetical protein
MNSWADAASCSGDFEVFDGVFFMTETKQERPVQDMAWRCKVGYFSGLAWNYHTEKDRSVGMLPSRPNVGIYCVSSS